LGQGDARRTALGARSTCIARRASVEHLPYLAQTIFNVPVAIAPPKAEVIIAGLAARLGIAHMIRASGERIAIQPMAFDEDDNVVYAWPSRRGRGDD
jgi:hypothetical protein